MVHFKGLPERTDFYTYFSLEFGAGFISLFAGASGMLYACQYVWYPCRLLYKAGGPLQIPMIIFLVILSISGAFLCVTSLVFVCGIAMKKSKVIPAFVVALFALPFALFLFHVMALIRVAADHTTCPVKLMGMKINSLIYYGLEILLSIGIGFVFADFALTINSFEISEEADDEEDE